MQAFTKSIELMIVGMGMTFAFLAMMVLCMNLLRIFVAFLGKYFPEKQPASKTPAAAGAGVNNAAIAIAIAAAKRFK